MMIHMILVLGANDSAGMTRIILVLGLNHCPTLGALIQNAGLMCSVLSYERLRARVTRLLTLERRDLKVCLLVSRMRTSHLKNTHLVR